MMTLNVRGPATDFGGYGIAARVVSAAELFKLRDYFDPSSLNGSAHRRKGHTFAMRNLLRDHAIVRDLANSPAMRSLIDPILGPEAIAVRGILFDKTPGANWKVPWHQDLSIAVMKQIDLPGYGPWSVKASVPHVQPPVEILKHMLTVRLHLDDCGLENGPLLVLPGSHVLGVLNGEQVDRFRREGTPVPATVSRGGAVLMRPLLLHASHAATSPGHRRVIHLEYSSAKLPEGLDWFIA